MGGDRVVNRQEKRAMKKFLHILKTRPDEGIARAIEALSAEGEAAVISLYDDEISGSTVNWHRLVDDIFDYDQIICW